MLVKCDNCNKEINKRPSQVREHNFCCNECYGIWRSKNITGDKVHNHKEKILYPCDNCGKIVELFESKYEQIKNGNQKNCFCSKECKAEWDSFHFIGEGNANYQGGDIEKTCEYCGKKYYVQKHRDGRTRFCSRDCVNAWQKDVLAFDKDWLDFRRNVGIKTMQQQKNRYTKPELITREYLDEHNILYYHQHKMHDMFVVDFYLYELDIVIEVLGDYWHGNPKFYGESEDKIPLKDWQITTRQKDQRKYNHLINEGHKVFMLWEDDIYKNINECMRLLNI